MHTDSIHLWRSILSSKGFMSKSYYHFFSHLFWVTQPSLCPLSAASEYEDKESPVTLMIKSTWHVLTSPHLILSYLILSYLILSYLILSYLSLPYLLLFYLNRADTVLISFLLRFHTWTFADCPYVRWFLCLLRCEEHQDLCKTLSTETLF